MQADPASADGPVCSFAPVATPNARVLILGSMPGGASLRARQYYAHPRNLFWPLMGELYGVDPTLPYARRIAAFTACGFALWDVLARCRRSGSLDARIERDSEEPNDLTGFVAEHPRLVAIAVNGALADQALRRHHPALATTLRVLRMPSTSPANASIPLDRKRQAWAQLGALLEG